MVHLNPISFLFILNVTGINTHKEMQRLSNWLKKGIYFLYHAYTSQIQKQIQKLEFARAPSYYSESWSMKDKHVSCFLCQIAFQGNQEADEGLLLSRRLPAARCKGNNGIKNGHFTSSNEIVRNVHRYMLKM